MVRDLRIKEYRFEPSSLTASAAGRFDSYSDRTLNGTIQKIEFLGGNFTATGSLQVSVSGTNEVILQMTSGPSQGNIADGTQIYTHVYTFNNIPTTGSPNTATQRNVNSNVRIVGSGAGNAKSGIGVNIIYI